MKKIFLVYKCDEWLSNDSKQLVYVGEVLDECVAQIQAYKDCTIEQASQLMNKLQSQCNNVGYEWLIEEVNMNCFCD